MHRIDTPTAQKDKFGAGKNGFTRGNPQTGTPATDLDDDYFDMLQEELVGIVEGAGITLDKTKRNQLGTALPLFLGLKTAALRDVGTGANQIPDMSSFTSTTGDQGKFVLPGGLIIQYVKMAIPANVPTNTDRNFTWGTAMSNTMACWCSIEGLATLRSANIVFTNNSGAVINYINNSSITTSAWGFCLGKL